MCFPIWELLLCLFLQTPPTIQSLSVTPPPPVSNTQAVPWLSGAQPSQSPWDRPRLMHKNSHKEPEKHCRSPSSVPAQTAKTSSPPPCQPGSPRAVPWLFGSQQQQPLSPSARSQTGSSHKHSPALPQLHGSQEGQPLPAWANSGIFLSPTDSQKKHHRTRRVPTPSPTMKSFCFLALGDPTFTFQSCPVSFPITIFFGKEVLGAETITFCTEPSPVWP